MILTFPLLEFIIIVEEVVTTTPSNNARAFGRSMLPGRGRGLLLKFTEVSDQRTSQAYSYHLLLVPLNCQCKINDDTGIDLCKALARIS